MRYADDTMNIELNQATIKRALPRVPDGLRQYTWLQTELRRRGVSRDREYQKKFNRFYRVRRNPAWQRVFYRILEQSKSDRPSLSAVLLKLYAATGRVEASFASKLLATVDPRQPVIDSIVLTNLRARLSSTGPAQSRIKSAVRLHNEMTAAFSKYLHTAQGRNLVTQFKAAYPEAQVTEVKMLDLVLWQTRYANLEAALMFPIVGIRLSRVQHVNSIP